MRVPQSPHSLRKVVSTSSDSDDSSSETSSEMKPPRPFSKKELRPPMHQQQGTSQETPQFTRTSRDRTRISAVQRLVERKMAQKEKDREKERDLMFKRSSSVGSTSSRMVSDNDKLLRRSLSRERLSAESNKTYITISSGGKATRIRESSPTKVVNKDVLNKSFSPLKSTEIFKDLVDKNSEAAKTDDIPKPDPPKPERKISFTTEKTIQIGNPAPPTVDEIAQTAKIRKVSIDINYVYEQHYLNNPGEIQDEQFMKEASKRRSSLEQKIKERSNSASSSMSTSSSEGSNSVSSNSSDSSSSLSTPEPVPRQSKQRKMSSGFSRNINIIMEDEISNDNCETTKRMNPLPPGLNLPKPKTSFHRRFSQDHSMMSNVNIKRSSSPVRKISLQNNSTINTDSLADQKKEEGNQLYLAKNYREALQRYNEAISLCPGCPAFYGNRAACHMMLGQFVQALEDARTSVQLEPNFVKGYIRVAKCCVALGEIHAARQAINTAMSKNTDDSQSFDLEKTSLDFLDKHENNLRMAFDQKDYRKALYHIDQALKIASASQRLKLSRAECLAYLGRFKEAQDMANDLLRNDSTNVEAIHIRGLCLYYEDNLEKALSHFQQVLKLAPDFIKAKEAFKRARQLKSKRDEATDAYKGGRFQEAFDLYSTALTIDPTNKTISAKLYCSRATVLAKMKKWNQSIEDANLAISNDKKFSKAYLRRAKSLMELGKFEEAIRDYEHLHYTDRSNYEYRQLLNQAKLELKKSKQKDYYKILGVDKNANDEEIKKAYRKRALEHHPDRHVGGSEEEKAEHETKFKEIGEAYAVLSDSRKKANYDAGQDVENGNENYNHFNTHHMDAAQMFKAFFGSGPGMHHAYQHHFGFGSSSHQMPGNFFQFS